MGKLKNDWQHVNYIFKMFGQKVGYARRSYAAFVAKGIDKLLKVPENIAK